MVYIFTNITCNKRKENNSDIPPPEASNMPVLQCAFATTVKSIKQPSCRGENLYVSQQSYREK